MRPRLQARRRRRGSRAGARRARAASPGRGRRLAAARRSAAGGAGGGAGAARPAGSPAVGSALAARAFGPGGLHRRPRAPRQRSGTRPRRWRAGRTGSSASPRRGSGISCITSRALSVPSTRESTYPSVGERLMRWKRRSGSVERPTTRSRSPSAVADDVGVLHAARRLQDQVAGGELQRDLAVLGAGFVLLVELVFAFGPARRPGQDRGGRGRPPRPPARPGRGAPSR